MRSRASWLMASLTLGALAAGPAAAAEKDADPTSGFVLDLRYRYAHINTEGYADPGTANTLRITLGYLWPFAPNWSAYAEGTRVYGLFGDDYNSGANGKNKLPSEGDPPSSEISGAWLQYNDGTASARVGRQYVNLDNQRFFTSGLWRQNPQSFDAVSTSWRFDTGTTLRYLYLDNVTRSVGHDYPDPTQSAWSLEGHLLHVDQTVPLGTLTGYGYFVENDTQAKYSWRTEGLRWTGRETLGIGTLAWTVEGAQQRNWRNNPAHYTADYRLLELSYGISAVTLKLGNEVLGGDGTTAFSSPYGSNHGFNGWASEFKNVPVNGLDDRYVNAFGKIGQNWGWLVVWHDFYAERGDRHYGSEWNAGLTWTIVRGLTAEFDYATYHSDGFAVSERKLWAALEYKYGPQGGGS